MVYEYAHNTPARCDYVHGCTDAAKTGVESGHLAKATAPVRALDLRPVVNSCNMCLSTDYRKHSVWFLMY